MKKILLLSSLMILGPSFCFAKDTDVSMADAVTDTRSGPCKQILEICQNAKYTKDGHANGSRGLYEDCVQPMMSGKNVFDIAVDPKFVDACTATLAKSPSKPAPNEVKLASDTPAEN